MIKSIGIEKLRFDCLLGVFSHERKVAQPVVVDIDLSFKLGKSYKPQFNQTIDYSEVARQIIFILQCGQFSLIEEAVTCLTCFLHNHPNLQFINSSLLETRVSIAKSQALLGKGIPKVDLVAKSGDLSIKEENQKFGRVDIFFENNDVGIYGLNIEPGSAIPWHYHKKLWEAEFIIHDGLINSGRAVPANHAFLWPKLYRHCYENPTAKTRTVLCINRPKFDPSDEVEVKKPTVLPAPIPGIDPLHGSEMLRAVEKSLRQ